MADTMRICYRLEEVQEYCENQLSCRRQTFCDKFTETHTRLNRCGRMCDNCKHQSGVPRRTFLPPPQNNSSSVSATSSSNRPTRNTASGANKRKLSDFEDNDIDDDAWINANPRQTNTSTTGSRSTISTTTNTKVGFVKASQWSNSTTQAGKTATKVSTSNPAKSDFYDVVDGDDDDIYVSTSTQKKSAIEDEDEDEWLSAPVRSNFKPPSTAATTAALLDRPKPTFVKASTLSGGKSAYSMPSKKPRDDDCIDLV